MDKKEQSEELYDSDGEALLSNDLFKFLLWIRQHTGTFDIAYKDEPIDGVTIRTVIHEYTGEPTDLPTQDIDWTEAENRESYGK